mmetsp:Transcript_66977/g.108615  ORF Transcript_66977/g.108615 Transcript_66977/m.108615 type:complete len:301 (-) Transcript_66977:9-911(-)
MPTRSTWSCLRCTTCSIAILRSFKRTSSPSFCMVCSSSPSTSKVPPLSLSNVSNTLPKSSSICLCFSAIFAPAAFAIASASADLRRGSRSAPDFRLTEVPLTTSTPCAAFRCARSFCFIRRVLSLKSLSFPSLSGSPPPSPAANAPAATADPATPPDTTAAARSMPFSSLSSSLLSSSSSESSDSPVSSSSSPEPSSSSSPSSSSDSSSSPTSSPESLSSSSPSSDSFSSPSPSPEPLASSSPVSSSSSSDSLSSLDDERASEGITTLRTQLIATVPTVITNDVPNLNTSRCVRQHSMPG